MPTILHADGYIDNNKPHIMLDLETLARTPNACVKSISLATMFPDDHIEIFNVWLDPDRQWGGAVSADTIAYWEQLYATFPILKEVEDAAPKQIASRVLRILDNYLSQSCFKEGYYLWSNGADFDIPILRTLRSRALVSPKTQELPNLHYQNLRCFRTIRNTFLEIKEEWEETIIHCFRASLPPHFSLVDALRQLFFIALLADRNDAVQSIFSLLVRDEFLKVFMVQPVLEVHSTLR